MSKLEPFTHADMVVRSAPGASPGAPPRYTFDGPIDPSLDPTDMTAEGLAPAQVDALEETI